MIYIKFFALSIIAYLAYYIYYFIKINRTEISLLFKRFIKRQNPILIYSFVRFLLKIIRRIFFRIWSSYLLIKTTASNVKIPPAIVDTAIISPRKKDEDRTAVKGTINMNEEVFPEPSFIVDKKYAVLPKPKTITEIIKKLIQKIPSKLNGIKIDSIDKKGMLINIDNAYSQKLKFMGWDVVCAFWVARVASDHDNAANKKKTFPEIIIFVLSISQKRINNDTPQNPIINPKISFISSFFLNKNEPNRKVIMGLVVGTITPPKPAIPTWVPLR